MSDETESNADMAFVSVVDPEPDEDDEGDAPLLGPGDTAGVEFSVGEGACVVPPVEPEQEDDDEGIGAAEAVDLRAGPVNGATMCFKNLFMG